MDPQKSDLDKGKPVNFLLIRYGEIEDSVLVFDGASMITLSDYSLTQSRR
jgi:hypothetical protein